MSEKKKSRMDKLAQRVDDLEQALALTYEMANKTRHIMTRIEGYSDAYDRYNKDVDNVAMELDIKASRDEGN
jgi:hypothetical protein